MNSAPIVRSVEILLYVSVVLIICPTCGSNALASPSIDGCPVFGADNIWNATVDTLPLDPNSQSYITTIGASNGLHADFGSGLWDGGPIGIPYTIVSGAQALVNVSFDYAEESDPGPYPIPPDAFIEGGSQSGGDRHVLVVDRDNCVIYELYAAYPQANGSWHAGSGAIFDLRSNALRPSTWTSADAAGLPILPGLVRYEEVIAGEIRHAVRFTAPQTRNTFIWPARHQASSLTGQQYPPMGQRFRLKADFDISGFSEDARIILTALKKYGMILADNGSSWYISGAPDPGWNNDVLHELGRVTGSAFEAIDESSLMMNPNSGQIATQPTEYQLITNVNISQAGLVAPDCSTGCYYDGDAVAHLVAVAAAGYIFGSWSGDCSGNNPSVSVIMTAPRTCTANLSACANQPVQVLGSASYDALQVAYDNNATINGDTIQILATSLTESVNLGRDITVILKGGFDCDRSGNNSASLLTGTLTVSGGAVIINRIVIR